MSAEFSTNAPDVDQAEPNEASLGSSTLYTLIEALITLTGRNDAQHKLFTQDLTRTRTEFKSAFDTFARETQRAYQQLRQDLTGEKRASLSILNELLEQCLDLEQICAAKPDIPETEEMEPLRRWAEGVEIQKRKAEAALARLGVVPYDAVIGSAYDPKLHERIGSTQVEGMGPLLVAEQRSRGYASQIPEFVLRRPRILVTE